MKSSFLKSAVALITCGLVVFGAGHASDQQKLPGRIMTKLVKRLKTIRKDSKEPVLDCKRRSLTRTATLFTKIILAI